MANLNLSQFTEKTFVADADWTFVWDTAGAISKKVSRNNWLNSGTLAGASAPITVSQTWNDAAVAFTALKVNAVSTASATGSLLLDLQVGGTSKFSVEKNVNVIFRNNAILFEAFGAGTSAIQYIGQEQLVVSRGIDGSKRVLLNNAGVFVGSNSAFGFASTNEANATADTILLRDGAANTLALRNGAAAQTFRVYNTYTDASNYERGVFGWASNELNIATGKSGSGLSRNILLAAEGALKIYTANSTYGWQFTTAGHFFFNSDNSSDIGASGANRPRNVYVGSRITCADFLLGSSAYFTATANGRLLLQNSSATDFDRLQLGGTADTFPAIARDGAGIKFTGAAAGLTSHIKVPAVAVTSLPSAATAGVGARAFVNDALAPVFGSAVANGGSAKVPVYSDGSAWYVG
jgi:hypothetical protein